MPAMPALIEPRDDLTAAVQQIMLSSSDNDYIDQLIPVMKDARQTDRAAQLIQALNQVSSDREADIERICNTNSQDFISSVDQLQRVREGTLSLTSEVLRLAQAIQSSTEKLLEQKRALVESRSVRQSIDETSQALQDCLEVLKLANQVHDLLAQKNHYAALRALDELQNVHLRAVTRYKIAEMIEKSVPATQRLIAEAVMSDLNSWLFRIRETSQYVGEVAFYHTQMRRQRQKDRLEISEYAGNFKLNSAIELVADETEEFDVLNNDNEEVEIEVDFTPLFECMHIHNALGQSERFRAEYANTRRKQKDLLLPTHIDLTDEEDTDLTTLLESITGFAIIERSTMKKTESLRSAVDVDELWDSMCQSAINLISNALNTVNNDGKLLKIKSIIAMFIQTMDSWGYSITSLDALLLTLFGKYAELLKQRFSEDFSEIVSTDDYMPMPISNAEDYEKVVTVSWYSPDKRPEQIKFPTVFPFSQMYPLCCIDIRSLLNQIYLFSDDHFQNSDVIDDTLKNSLDELLCTKVCQSLVDRLSSQYPGQIVQILTNLGHFETACKELQELLVEARTSGAASGPVVLKATAEFETGKKTAEKRIFELVNSKIDDLVETAEYDWTAPSSSPNPQPSLYMQELTRYLSNIMSSVLLGLPTEIKELIYFDALSHAATSVLSLPLDPIVTKITPAAVQLLDVDVKHLSQFVDSLGNAILHENLDELRQTVELMGTENKEEFFDVGLRNRRYGRVDKVNGAVLLEKVTQGAEAVAVPESSPAKPSTQFSTFKDRLGIR
ncbi:exocyst complex subunit Sec15-like protein [Viridothelium virens]|uniref:Exocyst complex component SEC15 n=1 Tax=Viridothelium virens TaxID=1048519 RepID=A0A6A6H208_VIRVR|nr:exocyst complex subunit Sec15-like protein [Viridothelium virens]